LIPAAQGWAFAHFRSFQKWIALFVTLLKSAIVQSHFLLLFIKGEKSVIAQSLFGKEQMCKNVHKSANFQIVL